MSLPGGSGGGISALQQPVAYLQVTGTISGSFRQVSKSMNFGIPGGMKKITCVSAVNTPVGTLTIK